MSPESYDILTHSTLATSLSHFTFPYFFSHSHFPRQNEPVSFPNLLTEWNVSGSSRNRNVKPRNRQGCSKIIAPHLFFITRYCIFTVNTFLPIPMNATPFVHNIIKNVFYVNPARYDGNRKCVHHISFRRAYLVYWNIDSYSYLLCIMIWMCTLIQWRSQLWHC